MGRRDGSHTMDAGGLAEHGRRLRPRRPRIAFRQARRRLRRHGALPDRARELFGAAKPGAARSRCRPATRALQTTGRCVLTRNGTIWAYAAPTTAFARPGDPAKLWIPVAGGPAFLVGQNFQAVYSYNPSRSYALALCHLGDLIRGDPPFRQQFPGGERTPTLEEVKEIQRRLSEHGFKNDVDGRTGSDTVRAIIAFQKKVGMEPDGYAGLKLLARLRQGP